MDVTWQEGRWFPTLIKGGALGLVDGDPVYAAGMTQPWRETELVWRFDGGDWQPAPPMPRGRCYTKGATCEQGLLVVGGRKRSDAWLLRREDDALTWIELPSLGQERAECALAVANGVAVAAGGGVWETKHSGAFTGDGVTAAERLDLERPENGWHRTASPPFPPRVSFSGTAIDSTIWFVGGYNCHVDENGVRTFDYFRDVWRYDTDEDTWSEAPGLPFRLSGHDVVAVDDRYLLLLGGCVRLEIDGQLILYQTTFMDEKRKLLTGGYSDLVWCYDTCTGTCELLPERMPHGLNDLRATTDGDHIYVVGGENADPSTSNTTEWFMVGEVRR